MPARNSKSRRQQDLSLAQRSNLAHSPFDTAPDDPPSSPIMEPKQSFDSSPSVQFTTTGHVQRPTFTREPTTLESISRIVHNFVPSSFSTTPAPKSPRSNPSSPTLPSRFPPIPPPSSRRTPEYWSQPKHPSRSALPSTDTMDQAVFNLDEELIDTSPPVSPPLRNTTETTEEIIWAGWDELVIGSADAVRRLLLVGYNTGLNIWDCTDLASVTELLNLSGSQWGAVHQAGILPTPSEDDELESIRPLVGIVSRTSEDTFLAYSLRTHQVIRRISHQGLTSFAHSTEFLVISTSFPHHALFIYSPSTFELLHTVSSAELHVPRFSLEKPTHNMLPTSTIPPRPVFALQGRLLAYCSTPPRQKSITRDSESGHGYDKSTKISQSDIGSAAAKIGSTVLSSMKTLGGMAFSAARAGVNSALVHTSDVSQPLSEANPTDRLFSRSAPTESIQAYEDTGYNDASVPHSLHSDTYQTVSAATRSLISGCFVTVVDLKGLSLSEANVPRMVTEFSASTQQISSLQFSPNGTTLAAARQDGQIVKVFHLRTAPLRFLARMSSPAKPSGAQSLEESCELPSHMYNLRRGRTSARIQQVVWDPDAQWIAISSDKGTVHVFPVNPFGGQPNVRNHVDGQVLNSSKVDASPVDVSPITRIHQGKSSSNPHGPTFVTSCFLPRQDIRSLLTSDRHSMLPICQPLLIFNSHDGVLSLHLINMTEDTQYTRQSSRTTSPIASSVSLPSNSNPENSSWTSGLTNSLRNQDTFTAHVSMLTTWSLKRADDWKEVLCHLHMIPAIHSPESHSSYNHQAELSTNSTYNEQTNRAIYLSHQFTFYTFKEDYHGLLHSYHLDLPAKAIDVRKEIVVNSSTEDGVLEDDASYSAQTQPRAFNEPLATAMIDGIQQLPPSLPIPMFPNGQTGSSAGIRHASVSLPHVTKSWGDGMSDNLHKLYQLRSPKLKPVKSQEAPVSLQFDEDEEDYHTQSSTEMLQWDVENIQRSEVHEHFEDIIDNISV
ncbi:hypothetical protein C8Q75DRAFT_278928 [Abortiporus biennis]|nr:hypothetical protein C8Q75DRAFT_278928 [Abortiporus biennis]